MKENNMHDTHDVTARAPIVFGSAAEAASFIGGAVSITLCGAARPGSDPYCVKPAGHRGGHVACLGYHPPPIDEYEWAEWPQEDTP